MNVCVLFASPRPQGNTAALLAPLVEEFQQAGHCCSVISLYEKKLAPCYACRRCQQEHVPTGCAVEDDFNDIYRQVLDCDLLVLASPIYSWYCTAPMKAVMDRLVYAMNMYYGGKGKGPAFWAGKAVALLTTCGLRPEQGAPLWEEGMRRYCKVSQLRYCGMLAGRHYGYDVPFMDEEKEQQARAFAHQLMEQLSAPAEAE